MGQDVWANIWNAVLAVRWPSRVGSCAVALAGSGGAAVALAWKNGLYPKWAFPINELQSPSGLCAFDATRAIVGTLQGPAYFPLLEAPLFLGFSGGQST
ncbi:MAG: hypothetical protein RLZZ433_1201 [Pseudomonadota bacterium]